MVPLFCLNDKRWINALSALMAPLLFLLLLLSEAASDLIVVIPGDDVILPCQAADPSISAVAWTRPDLDPDTVLIYSDGHLNTDDQHPSYKDRVDLVDRHLKDGDVSLTLKNVNINDAGTYDCRVKIGYSDPIRTIRTIRLQVTDQIEVTVHPGDDVTLPCRSADSSIRGVEWSRPDLEPDTTVLYKDEQRDRVHPSFRDRVELVDRDLKDGDVSLTLKNVNINDAGTYECRVASGGSRRKKRGVIISDPISTVRLQVTEPGSPGLAAGVVGLLLAVAVAAVAVAAVAVAGVLYKRQKRPGQPDAAGYKQPAETTP